MSTVAGKHFLGDSDVSSPKRPKIECVAANKRTLDDVCDGPSSCKKVKTDESSFAQQRETLATALYKKYNEIIFGGKLPQDLPIIWNKVMIKVAGRCVSKVVNGVRKLSHIELSIKTIDRLGKL